MILLTEIKKEIKKKKETIKKKEEDETKMRKFRNNDVDTRKK